MIVSSSSAQFVRVDPAFAPQFDARVTTVKLQPDQQILVGGLFTNVNGLYRPRLARLMSDGSVDASFAPGWTSQAMIVWDIQLVNTNLYVLFAGKWPRNASDLPAYAVLQCSTDGTLKHVFPFYARFVVDSQQRLIWGTTQSLCRHGPPEVRYYDANTLAGPTRLAQLDCHGAPRGWDWGVQAITLQQHEGQEKILIGGYFGEINSNIVSGIARLNNDGSIDTTFQRTNSEPITAIAIGPDRKIYTGSQSGIFRRWWANGENDASFGSDPPTHFTTGTRSTILPQADGLVYVIQEDGHGSYLRRLNQDGTTDTNFLVQTSTTGLYPYYMAHYVETMAVQPNGEVLIGGEFKKVNCVERFHLARLIPSAEPDSSECFVPPPKPAPELSTTRLRGARMVCCWPTNYPEYTLQATPRLRPRHPEKERWVTVAKEPVCSDDGVCCVTNSIARYGRHYRLVKVQ